MIKFETLALIAAVPVSMLCEASSTGETRPPELFPKLNFHFDGFLVTTGALGATGTLGIEGGLPGDGDTAEGRRYRGKGYNEIGSMGWFLRLILEPDVLSDERDALLISRAKDCEATASVSNVSSCVKTAAAPLPFLAPRFRRLLVEVDLEVVPAISTSPSTSPSRSYCSSSYTVDSSEISVSYAGPTEGARERERDVRAGVLRTGAPEVCREEGRWDGRREDDMG
jgi:hypothetical protein